MRVAPLTATDTLSDEDTEANAITRLLAGGGGTWSSWAVPGGGTCAASYEQQTTLFTFGYTEAQFRVSITGLSASTAYHIAVKIYRKPYGSGSYTFVSTNIYGFTTDGAGAYQFSDDVPILKGYDTAVETAALGGICVYT